MNATRQRLAVLRAAGRSWTACAATLRVPMYQVTSMAKQPEFEAELREARERLMDAAVGDFTPRRKPIAPPHVQAFPIAPSVIERALLGAGLSRSQAKSVMALGYSSLRQRDADWGRLADPRDADPGQSDAPAPDSNQT